MQLYSSASAPPETAVIVELDTYMVLDGRRELRGTVSSRRPPAAETAQLELSLAPLAAPQAEPAWRASIPLPTQNLAPVPIVIPIADLPPGYYLLSGRQAGEPDSTAEQGLVVCVGGVREASGERGKAKRKDYLGFVEETVQTLLRHQSVHAGGDPQAPLALTVTRNISRSYRSLAHRQNGVYRTFWFPEAPLDYRPFLLDFDLWPILAQLGEATGSAQYEAMLEGMASIFAEYGFDPVSGLGYLGEEAALNVAELRVQSTKSRTAEPHFKPRNTGSFPALPLARLWRHAPTRMHRMMRSMYYGLVTDPASMDFNRFCSYGYDDSSGRQAMMRNSSHCGFDTAAGRMIHWWADCFARTGDSDCLRWAERMTDKWAAVQHPVSGLIPNFFGAVAPQEGAPMPPGKWAESRGAALTAVSWLEAAEALGQRPEGAALAARLTDMATRLARGLAQSVYDPDRRIFREQLHLDGTPYPQTARYTFSSQEEKQAAVQQDPRLAQVPVYDGAGFYTPTTYWEHCAGSIVPWRLAQVADRTGDRQIIEALRPMAHDAVEEARAQQRAFTSAGGWTFRATALYLKLLLVLQRLTGEPAYQDQACELADSETARLGQVQCPDWWRFPERAEFLAALLMLQS